VVWVFEIMRHDLDTVSKTEGWIGKNNTNLKEKEYESLHFVEDLHVFESTESLPSHIICTFLRIRVRTPGFYVLRRFEPVPRLKSLEIRMVHALVGRQ